MTADNIIVLPHKNLRKKSEKVTDFKSVELLKLLEDMKSAVLDWESTREHEYGVALAAVQINKLVRAVIIREETKNRSVEEFSCYINPKIIRYEGLPEFDTEGCLSIKNLYGSVPRYPKIKVQARDISGKLVKIVLTGFNARVFQHEIDHTNGITYLDRIGGNGKIFIMEKDGSLVPISPQERLEINRDYQLAQKPLDI